MGTRQLMSVVNSLSNVGKIDNGVVSLTSLWADERVYYPLETEPYTPESSFPKGKNDPHFRDLRSKLHCTSSSSRSSKDGPSAQWWRITSLERIVA